MEDMDFYIYIFNKILVFDFKVYRNWSMYILMLFLFKNSNFDRKCFILMKIWLI